MSRFVSWLFIITLVSFGFSQTDTYRFKHITDADGLSQNSVMDIHQDNLGQIWIGTKDGLNKYDGTDFTVYRYQKDNPSSISNNGIVCIEEDSEGFLWVGTSFGLNKYNPKTDKFKSYFLSNRGAVLGNNMIWDVKEMSNQELWVCHFDGVSVYDSSTDSYSTVFERKLSTSIIETRRGTVFVGTSMGLFKCSKKESGAYQFSLVPETDGVFINDIIESQGDKILLATKTDCVLEYDIINSKVQPYFEEAELKGKNTNARKLLFDDYGDLWVASFNGLYISGEQRKIKALYHDGNNDNSLNDNFLRTLFKDKAGSMWVGTYYGGLNVHSKFNDNFINITQKSSQEGLSFRVVSSIVNYKNLLFFGTEGGGISVLNQETNVIEHITSKNNQDLKSDNIKSLCLSNDEKLWIGTYNEGVFVYNLKTKQFDNSALPLKLKEYLHNTGVLKIVSYGEDDILIGTNTKGLIKLNANSKKYRVYSSKSKPQGLTNNNIKTITVDTSQNIWLGTLRGLNCVTSTNEIKNHVYSNDHRYKFEINTIYEGLNNELWIGTFEDGLFRFVNNEFEHIDLQVGNNHISSIRSIVTSDLNSFWVSTFTQGIIKYNFKEHKIERHFTQKDGLASNEFNRDASFRMGSRYFFGGPSGVTWFDENEISENGYVPQVIITDFKIKNQPVSISYDNALLSKAISFTKEVELSHKQGNFSLSFSIPNFINSKSNSYKYRLNGLETDWVKTNNNTASYTIQKPGEYIFEVKGVNSDGVINENPTTLKIIVRPAPWFTWLAYAIYAFIVGAVLYHLFRISKSKTKLKHQLELEHVEAEQIKKVNKTKLEFFTNISHEFRTPLTLILGPLQQITENYNGSSQMFKKLKAIQNNADHLLHLINRLMDFRKYENKLMSLQATEGNIVSFLKEIYLSFYDYAKSGNYQYDFYTPSNEIMVYFDSEKLERVFFNLISNAFKYTPIGGEITVRIIQENERVILSVEDTGKGIPDEYKDKIFERFFELSLHSKTDKEFEKGTGIGLSIVKNIVQLHKGDISVSSNLDGKGSIFKVELHIGEEHLAEQEIVKGLKFVDDINFYENQLDENRSPVEDNFFEKVHSKEKSSILLVEDNEELRKFMRSLLKNEYNVFEAENGKKAYEIAVKEPIDLIVSDVVMPLTSGIELCALIKDDIRTSHIPVILLTSRSTIMHKLEGLESGADDYINKPFNIHELKLRIDNMLKSIARLKIKMNTHEVFKAEDVTMSSLDEKLYKRALEIVQKNISNENFDIPYFCEELGVSKSVLFTKVKAWTDFTPKQFIQHIRLARAAQYLEQGKITIGQICNKVGFKDQKYFSRSFKAKFGKTPRAYSQSFLEF